MVSITLFDLNGRLVSNLVNEVKNAGNHTISMKSYSVNPGAYLIALETPDNRDTRKIITVSKKTRQ
jgi:hypothetical protein